jgi:hypothetical protein
LLARTTKAIRLDDLRAPELPVSVGKSAEWRDTAQAAGNIDGLMGYARAVAAAVE